ncbi:MAG: isoprenylcysteine carboxylmethyltransferase family protein [Deltaproteobacteria bacterium]|jgi:protein-S-isoprenylcysteine O-methyltransferase Ste14|nr:isoprenylcysteine carboxylmethyltransferase family protein [Deltaproteobacteria bacterium]MCL5880441.1 isoprenylcysteine carboxylmethyltransferase family protein [Deltaproteobacteria bacterium]MDA8304622.1 isoprenylcysteine carboxylmethyltransferase family protein [Deltaproteobacteria bacterium]
MSYPIWLKYPYLYIFSAIFVLIVVPHIFIAKQTFKQVLGHIEGKVYDLRWTQIYIILVTTATLTGILLSFGKIGRIEWHQDFWFFCGLFFLSAGATIRLIAILTLGRYFSPVLTIRQDHILVERGIYSLIRHPAYTGLFLFMLGFGLLLGNWLSMVIIFAAAITIAFFRVPLEEKALIEKFGDEYRSYMIRTKRYIPYLF